MANHPIVIVGGGGHTKVLIGMLKRLELPIQGIITSNDALLGGEVHGVPVLGLEGQVSLSPQQVAIVNGVGNWASSKGSGLDVRAAIYQRYTDQGFFVAPVISNRAITQPDIMLGHGVQVMPGAVIQPGAMVGENAIINTRAAVDHDCVIAPHVHVAPGAVLCGSVSVGERTHIGAGAIIIQGVKIGANVVIGAGVTVTRDVADNEVVRGQ